MKSVLIEGTELSGKTTLAESVRQKLENKGYGATVNIGPIDKKSLFVNMPLGVAQRIKLPSFQELMYTLSLMADREPGKIYDGIDFFIQERCFPSVIAYSKVLVPFGINRYAGNMLRRRYPSFDVNVLLKTSIDARLERIKLRKRKTKLDEMVEENPRLSVDLEREIQRVLCGEKNYFELNTGYMTIEEATEEMVRRIL